MENLERHIYVVDQSAPERGAGDAHGSVTLIDANGVPVDIGGGGSVAWDDVQDKPETFPPTIGTTADTALAGDTVIPPAYTLPDAGASTRGGVLQGAAVADPTDETEVEAQLTALLVSLRAAGVLAS